MNHFSDQRALYYEVEVEGRTIQKRDEHNVTFGPGKRSKRSVFYHHSCILIFNTFGYFLLPSSHYAPVSLWLNFDIFTVKVSTYLLVLPLPQPPTELNLGLLEDLEKSL